MSQIASPNPKIQVVFGVASGLQLIGGISVSWILWRRRSLPALKIRNVPLVLAQLWSLTICMLAYGSIYLFLSFNCFWQAMFTFVPLMSFVASMTVRCYLLNLVFSASVEGAKLAEKLGNAKGIDASEKLKRLKKLYQPKVILCLFVFEAIVISLPYIITASVQASSVDVPSRLETCSHVYTRSAFTVVVTMLVVGAVILAFFYLRIRHVRDSFRIKEEITSTIALFVSIAVAIAVLEISRIVAETGVYALLRLIYYAQVWIGIGIALHYSIPEERLIPCIRPVRSEQNTYSTRISSNPNSLESLKKEMEFRFLHTDQGFEAFKDFLVKEFSSENAFFYKQWKNFADRYDSLSPEQRVSTGKMILGNFISEDAALCVNISFLCRKTTLSAPPEDPKSFEPAIREILDLMVKDSFKRFRVSPEYSEFMENRSKSVDEIVDAI
jgi:hypothetical protein